MLLYMYHACAMQIDSTVFITIHLQVYKLALIKDQPGMAYFIDLLV